MRRVWRPLTLVLVTAAFVAGCSGDTVGVDDLDGDVVDLTGQEVVTVDVRDNVFEPERIAISAGTEVRWENRGRTPHNVVAADEGAFEDIPVSDLQPGDEASRTFDEPGAYPYFCSLHGTATRGQIGEIIVVGD